MTAIHITLTRDRALIATDSTTYTSDDGEPGADVIYHSDGEPVAVTKLAAVPTIRAVLAIRGKLCALGIASQYLRHARDFEDAVGLLAKRLPEVVLPAGTYKGKPLVSTCYLIGWNEARGAMCTAELSSADGYRPHVTPAGNGTAGTYDPYPRRPDWHFDNEAINGPRAAEYREYLRQEREREPRCLDTAAAFARYAIEQAREQDRRAPYGGRLYVAEVLRDRITIVDAGDVGLPWRRPGARDLVGEVAGTRIQAGAATDAYADETGPDSVSIGGTGGSNFKTCASRSWTNTYGAAVVVQWDAIVSGLHFSSGGTLATPDDYVIGQWVAKVNGTPVLSDAFIDTSVEGSIPRASSIINRQSGWQYTLSPGDTIEVSIVVGGATDVNAVTISWARTRLRTTVIKR